MDWKTLITEIQRTRGLSQAEIARMVGCSQPAISGLLNGKSAEPSYSLGARLVALLKPTRKASITGAK